MRRAAAAAALALAAGCGDGERAAAPPVPSGPPLTTAVVARGLDRPLGAVADPSRPGRLLVVTQPGLVVALRAGRPEPRPFLDLRRAVRVGEEQGLLALALHPRYPRDPRVYVHFTDRRGDTRVAELRARAGRVVRGSRRGLLHLDQPHVNHNGGSLAFAPDGRLWLGLGDGGDAFDPEGRSQSFATRLGKLLSIDPDRPGEGWRTEASGVRNPWRIAFDRRTGDLWVADVGQDEAEEVNVLRRGLGGIPNLGWDAYEGRERRPGERLVRRGPLVWPVATYGHDRGCSITGGLVYRGRRLPSLRGRYVYGDFCSGAVWSLDALRAAAPDVRREPVRVPALAAFAGDGRGGLLAVSLAGTVVRLRPATG